MRSEVCVVALSVLAAIGLGTSTCQGIVYELKQDNVTCIIINSTLVVSVDYVNNLNKTVSTSWALTKPGLNSTSGSCASRTPLHSWSEIVINATDATIGFRFVSHANGKVSLANVSLAVNIVNGSHFINPKSPSRVQFVAQLNLPLSSNTECFACKSSIALAVRPSVKTVTSTGVLKLTGGTIVQAFNLTKGKFSDKVARCPQDSNHTTTTTVAPVTTSAPASEPPLLTLTVNSSQTGKPCLRLRSRFQLEVPYLLPGMVSKAIIFLREDATATGNCGDGGSGANGTAPTHQTMTIKFFNDWLLTFSLARTGSTYSLMGLKLDYNVNNAAVFPDATDAGKNISTSRNETLISDVPSNGYYNCKLVDFSLNGRSVPLTKEVTRIKLTVTEFTMQAFRSAAINSTKEFVGEQKECMQDKVNSIVPIVVGASLAALVVIVLLAYLISRRRATARDGYQSV